MEFRHDQLPNGLTLLAERNPSAASAAIGFFVRAGGRDESPAVLGVSHFLEHMVFKGTPRRSGWDVNREFDELGADYNAGTTEESTFFYAAVLPECLEGAIDLLADILRPALREDDFEVERKVVLEEIALYKDQPRFRLYDAIMAEYFRGHPLGHAILGTTESISALTPRDMAEYFRRHYVPSNITFAAAGNLDFDRLRAAVEQRCGAWSPGQPPQRQAADGDRARGQKVLLDPAVCREHMALICDAPAAHDAARYAAQLLCTIVGDSSGSRLYYELVEPALADEASMAYSPMDGAGVFLTFLSTDTDKASEALGITRRQLRRFMDEGPAESELLAAKNKIASGATLKGEIPMGRLTDIGFDWMYRTQYEPLAYQIEQLFAVTTGEVRDLARRWDLEASLTMALGQAEKL